MRSSRDAGEGSNSGRVSRTSATSSGTRGSADWRISTSAVPIASSALVMAGARSRSAWTFTRSRTSSVRWVTWPCMRTRKAFRNSLRSCSPTTRGSRPRSMAWCRADSAAPVSRSASASIRSTIDSPSSVTPPVATMRSRAESVSRADPPPSRRARATPSPSTSSPASATTSSTSVVRSSAGSRVNSRCWVRLRMVGSTSCGSVVANTKTTCSGGSSNVLSSAAEASLVSMCTSSRMYMRVRPGLASAVVAMRSRMSSMRRLDAASSSVTSNELPASTATHESHTPQGSPSAGFVQLRTLARMRAVEVLPVPRGPLKR